jgi:hypothetical protein
MGISVRARLMVDGQDGSDPVTARAQPIVRISDQEKLGGRVVG